MIYSGVKRIFIISDLHFGVRSNSIEWLEIQKDYFYNFFIPKVKDLYQPGDLLFCLGDVFDNRQSINILVLNETLKIFKELSNIFKEGIHIILGNHDIYKTQTNEVNSLKTLGYLNNVHIFEEPIVNTYGYTQILLMPWRKNHESENEVIHSNTADYLFCHTDISGLRFNKSTFVEHGNSLSDFNAFQRVYSGHIHFRQEVDNIRMVGSPYQLTRSDSYNEKGFWILDLKDNSETWIINNHSPKFLKFNFDKILNLKTGDFKKTITNNFVDLHVNSEYLLKYDLNSVMNQLDSYARRLELFPIELNQSVIEIESEEFNKNLNILNLAHIYINDLQVSEELKAKVKSKIDNLFFQIESEIEI